MAYARPYIPLDNKHSKIIFRVVFPRMNAYRTYEKLSVAKAARTRHNRFISNDAQLAYIEYSPLNWISNAPE